MHTLLEPINVVPDPPTNLIEVSRTSVGDVSLSWTAPSNNGGTPITDYIIENSLDEITWWVLDDDTDTSTAVTFTGVSAGNDYYFRVSAVNEVGTGLPSSSLFSDAVRVKGG